MRCNDPCPRQYGGRVSLFLYLNRGKAQRLLCGDPTELGRTLQRILVDKSIARSGGLEGFGVFVGIDDRFRIRGGWDEGGMKSTTGILGHRIGIPK